MADHNIRTHVRTTQEQTSKNAQPPRIISNTTTPLYRSYCRLGGAAGVLKKQVGAMHKTCARTTEISNVPPPHHVAADDDLLYCWCTTTVVAATSTVATTRQYHHILLRACFFFTTHHTVLPTVVASVLRGCYVSLVAASLLLPWGRALIPHRAITIVFSYKKNVYVKVV